MSVEQLSSQLRHARKRRRCDYCCETIEKGELYEHTRNKYDNELYDWHSHIHCAEIASAIWDFADPDEGMTEVLFQDSVQQIMDELYCPANCDKWNEDDGCTAESRCGCLRKFAEHLKTHMLVQTTTEHGIRVWVLRKKEGSTE